MTKKRKTLGAEGEKLAREYLEHQGYRIIQANYSCRLGEIDLIADENGELVFVEVKTRSSSTYGLPVEAVNWRKQRKMMQIAFAYLLQHQLTDRDFRFDVVAITLKTEQPEIKLIKNAIHANRGFL